MKLIEVLQFRFLIFTVDLISKISLNQVFLFIATRQLLLEIGRPRQQSRCRLGLGGNRPNCLTISFFRLVRFIAYASSLINGWTSLKPSRVLRQAFQTVCLVATSDVSYSKLAVYRICRIVVGSTIRHCSIVPYS
jgi:hypothetical protein